jgi:hypothetical protein
MVYWLAGQAATVNGITHQRLQRAALQQISAHSVRLNRHSLWLRKCLMEAVLKMQFNMI